MCKGLPHVLAGLVLAAACAGWLGPLQKTLAEAGTCVQAGGDYNLAQRRCETGRGRQGLAAGPLWLLGRAVMVMAHQVQPRVVQPEPVTSSAPELN